VVLLVGAACATIVPSILQNRQVRQFADQLFLNYQDRNTLALQKMYQDKGADTGYFRQLPQYTLLGWKITRISGQPYPADTAGLTLGGDYNYNTISAELYYQPVGKLIKPKGRYTRMKHLKYGDCMVVPVTISYLYHPEQPQPWALKQPDTQSPSEWVLPFEKPLPGPYDRANNP